MESNEKIDMVIHKAVTSALQEKRDTPSTMGI